MLDYTYEDKFRSEEGYQVICGVDEAGRGPLAGPVVAAVCVLEPGSAQKFDGLNDSKTLSPHQRERLYEAITASAVAWCAAQAVVDEIDSMNILMATILAMNRAIYGLALSDAEFVRVTERDQRMEYCHTYRSSAHAEMINESHVRSGLLARGGSEVRAGVHAVPELALIDGNTVRNIGVDALPVVKGDALVPSIAAASIIAKVTRDRMCMEMHNQYPEYGFDRHKGYPTREHMRKLIALGPTPLHRKTFLGFLHHLDNYVHYLGAE